MNVPSRTNHSDGSLRLVTHEDGEPLGRWTFVERSGGDERSTTEWISVDPTAVVDLEERR